MNLEELAYLGAQGAGAVTGGILGFETASLGAALGGVLMGGALGWACCFFPFLLARFFEEKEKVGLSKAAWAFGFAAPLLTPLLVWGLTRTFGW